MNTKKPKKNPKVGLLLFIAVFMALGGIYFLTRSEAAPAPGLPTPTISVANAGGMWSTASTWSPARVPNQSDIVDITKDVVVDTDSEIAGMHIDAGAVLSFDPTKSSTLRTSGNIINNGTLRMRPNNSSILHQVKFINIDEAAFVGGCLYANYPIVGCSGMTPTVTDVGLWVIGGGKLEANGSDKTSWTRLAGAATAGQTTITLANSPTGWNVGDEISVTPTAPPSVNNHDTQFDLRKITAINGSQVTLDSALQFNHPVVNNPGPDGGSFRAEVLNLTRNVRIEGQDSSHRSHIFISSSSGQAISNLGIRFMGPHHESTSPERANQFVMGRYGLHFHMNSRLTHTNVGDGSQRPQRVVDAEYDWPGAMVDGVVIRDTDSHAFVAHESDNVTFKNTISYATSEEPYWWDSREFGNPLAEAKGNVANSYKIPNPSISNNITYDHAVAALVKPRTTNNERNYRAAGFYLAEGENLKVSNSVAVGVSEGVQSSGFKWPEDAHSVWEFNAGNISHNNAGSGIFGWQNDNLAHDIENTVLYHNGEAGVFHGAYQNIYKYANLSLLGNGTSGFEFHAAALRSRPISLSNSIIDGLGLPNTSGITFEKHALPAAAASRIANVNISNVTNKISVNATNDTDSIEWYDFVGVNLAPTDFKVNRTNPLGVNIRVQPNATSAFQFTDNTFTAENISPFDTISTEPKGAKGPWPNPSVSPQDLGGAGTTGGPTTGGTTGSTTGTTGSTSTSSTGTTTTTGGEPTSTGGTTTGTTGGTTGSTNCSRFDVDGSGSINILDALVLLNNRDSTDLDKYDIDGNERINILDALTILNNRSCQ